MINPFIIVGSIRKRGEVIISGMKTMIIKKIFLLLLLLVVINGCKKDNPTSSPPENSNLLSPVLVSPFNVSYNNLTSPILTWQKTGTQSYSVQVSSDSLFSILLNNETVKDTIQQVTGLTKSTNYYWRVRSNDGMSFSAWSTVWTFYTGPNPPMLSLPENNSINIALNPSLSWISDTSAISYLLQVSSTIDFSNLVYNQSGDNNANRQISGLNNGTNYYWRVNSTNSFGTSAWSKVFHFTSVGNSNLSSPLLISPFNISYNNITSPILTWHKTGTQSYSVQVSSDSLFSNLLYNETVKDTIQQVTGLTKSTTYYWRVRSTDSMSFSAWSTVWTFYTGPNPPMLSLPENNSINIALNPSLSWSSDASAISYLLQVSSTIDFSNLVYNQSGDNNTIRQISGLNNGTNYYWRVNSTNSFGTSVWSKVFHFTSVPEESSSIYTGLLGQQGNYAWEGDGLILKYGKEAYTLSNIAGSDAEVDIYFISYMLKSYTNKGRYTSFHSAVGNNLNDSVSAPIYSSESGWTESINISEGLTNYFYLYDKDHHYSKMFITSSTYNGVGWTFIGIKWIYNNNVDDPRF